MISQYVNFVPISLLGYIAAIFFSIGRQRKKVGKAFKKNSCTASTPKNKFRQSFELKKNLAGKIPPPPSQDI
jgi:hypothetical protein